MQERDEHGRTRMTRAQTNAETAIRTDKTNTKDEVRMTENLRVAYATTLAPIKLASS